MVFVMQLLEAVRNDNSPLVTETLNERRELINQRDENGYTLLYWAPTKGMAETLLKFVDDDFREEFLWSQSNDGRTAFDAAVSEQRKDVVEYLFKYSGGKVYPSPHPLHHAMTTEMAQFLVSTFPENERLGLLEITDNQGRTALHAASQHGFKAIVEYLCLQRKELPLRVDNDKNTALHLSRSAEIVQLLCEHAHECNTTSISDYVRAKNMVGNTALHITVADGNMEVAAKLCKIGGSRLVNCKNVNGDTALHLATTEKIAQLLIDCQPFAERSRYICTRNANGVSALDQALEENRATLDCLCHGVWFDLWLIPQQHVDRGIFSTMKQKSFLGEGVSKYVESFESLLGDNLVDGYSLALYLVSIGEVALFDDLLGYLDLHCKESLKQALRHTSLHKQNVFHLSSLSPFAEQLFKVLEQYFDQIPIEDVLTEDCSKSTPIQYLVGRGLSELSTKLTVCVPFTERKRYFCSRNGEGVSCVEISKQTGCPRTYFFSKVAPNTIINSDGCIRYTESAGAFTGDSPEQYVSPCDKMLHVVKYALNQYYCIDLKLDDIENFQEFMKASSSPSPAGQTWVWFLYDTNACALESIRDHLYKLDNSRRNHEIPKVFVILFPPNKKVTYLAPPGPDFIILTVVLRTPSLPVERDWLPPFTNVTQIIDHFREHNGVTSVNINSTLARHYEALHQSVPENALILKRAKKGLALAICNTYKRPYYRADLENTEYLCDLLGLECEVEYDKSADQVRKAIKEFATRKDHGTLAALFITSHGDGDGNICGNFQQSTFTPQEVVNLMKDIECFKFVFLTFCRGKVQQFNRNRTVESAVFENVILPASQPNLGRAQIGVPSETLTKERERRKKFAPQPPFPSIKVPEGMMLVYSTLPDSLLTGSSETCPWSVNKMLQGFIRHLSMKCQEQPDLVEVNAFLTDVAGSVREISDFTQYINFGCTVTRDSPPVYLEIGAV